MSKRVTGVDVNTIVDVRRRVAAEVVGRAHELDLLLAAVGTGRDLVIEGPPGTSKTTLLGAITREWGVPLVFVEGNADLTPSKLLGHHHPAQVLRDGYTPENFVDGPLLTAMREGGFLYIEEFNRSPDDTLNTLLTAMADREVTVPRVGTVTAKDSFRVIASMNPYDNVGTTRLSSSVHDRMCRLAIGYQDEAAEREIVGRRAVNTKVDLAPELIDAVRVDAVALTRATRTHPDIRQGSSVRGAIDLALMASGLLALRGVTSPGRGRLVGDETDPERAAYTSTMWDTMTVALSGRIHLDEVVDSTPESVLRQIWEDHYILAEAAAGPG